MCGSGIIKYVMTKVSNEGTVVQVLSRFCWVREKVTDGLKKCALTHLDQGLLTFPAFDESNTCTQSSANSPISPHISLWHLGIFVDANDPQP